MIITVTVWGSLNVRDQADELVRRSHAGSTGGYVQQAPMETPDAENMEYGTKGIRKRRGSELDASLTSLFATGETALAGIAWHNPATGAQIEVVVTTLSAYTSQSGSWAKLNASGAATAYTHAATMSVVGFAAVDGHLLWGGDGTSNYIQAYRSGASIDAPLQNANLWTSAYGATTKTISGVWADATYLLSIVHGRLAKSDGTNQMEYTPEANAPSSGMWDLGGARGGAQLFDGSIRMQATMNPGAGDAKDTVQYVGTTQGMNYLSGFEEYDRIEENIDPEAPLNHRAFFTAKNWLVYLTREKNIKAAHGNIVIDLGRRLRTIDADGPLDELNVTESEDTAFGFWDSQNEMGGFAFTTASGRVNDRIVILDFKLGEPMLGEPIQTTERKVRLMVWNIYDPDNNDWFIHIYRRDTELVGLTKTGKLYTLNTGNNDLDSIAITAKLAWPDFSGGDAILPNMVQWFRFDQSYVSVGKWDVTTRFYENRDTGASNEYLVNQVNPDSFIVGTSLIGDPLTVSGMVRNYRRVALRSEILRPEIEQSGQGETFTLHAQSLTYEPKAIVR